MASTARSLNVVAGTVPARKTVKKVSGRPTKALLAAKRREEHLAYVVGLGCLVGLCLSGIDSTFALNAFIRVPMWRAAMLAIIVDGLMVGAEIATLLSPCPK